MIKAFSGPSKHNLDQRDDGAQHFWKFPKLQWHLRVGESSSHFTIHMYAIICMLYADIFQDSGDIFSEGGRKGMKIVTLTEHWKSFDGILSEGGIKVLTSRKQ